jgi:hypothetical protein
MWVNAKPPKEVDALLLPRWKSWVETLAPEVKNALDAYKSGQHGLFAIAREGVAARVITQADEDRWRSLDRAFDGASWHRDTLVWRGFRKWVSHEGEPPDWKLPAVGGRAQFEVWTSTSLCEIVAANEAHLHQAREGDFSVLYEIEIPKGFPAIYMEAVKRHPTHEAEVLLPRGTPYEVVAVEQFTQLRTRSVHESFGPAGCWRVRLRVRPSPANRRPSLRRRLLERTRLLR